MTYRWNLKIVPPRGVLVPESINWLCESIDLPTMNHQPIDVNMRGFKCKTSGLWTSSDDISLDVYETVSNDVSNFIRNWRKAHYDLSSGVSSGSSGNTLKTTVTLTRLNNMDNEIYEYTLYGVMLNGSAPPRLDSASDAWKISMTLIYDWFEEKDLIYSR